MRKTFAITATAISALAVAVGVLAVTVFRPNESFASCGAAQVAGGSIGGPFELLNKDGETVTDVDVITGPSIIYFGYTFCPDVCPLDNLRNVEAVELLEERGYMATPLFITVDPDRDTPKVVGEFAENFHERMIGLSGSFEQVDAASKAYKTYYKKEENGDPDYYVVDHTTMAYLNIPGFGVIDFFRRDDSAEVVAERTACLIDQVGKV